jgi:hypothetical protein
VAGPAAACRSGSSSAPPAWGLVTRSSPGVPAPAGTRLSSSMRPAFKWTAAAVREDPMQCRDHRSLAVAAVCVWLAAAPLLAQSWRPGPCNPSVTRHWDAFEKAVRSAPPGSGLYAPVPYPRTQADVLKDFAYAYNRLRHGKTEADLPARERAFYNRFMAGKLRARIETVQNWTPTRCGSQGRHDFYFLLVLTDVHRRRAGSAGAPPERALFTVQPRAAPRRRRFAPLRATLELTRWSQ